MELMKYQWEVSPLISLDRRSQHTPRLFIPRGTLKPGSGYMFTLTTSYAADRDIFSKASVQVNVESLKLVAKIKGASSRVIGIKQYFYYDEISGNRWAITMCYHYHNYRR